MLFNAVMKLAIPTEIIAESHNAVKLYGRMARGRKDGARALERDCDGFCLLAVGAEGAFRIVRAHRNLQVLKIMAAGGVFRRITPKGRGLLFLPVGAEGVFQRKRPRDAACSSYLWPREAFFGG